MLLALNNCQICYGFKSSGKTISLNLEQIGWDSCYLNRSQVRWVSFHFNCSSPKWTLGVNGALIVVSDGTGMM